MMERIGYFLAKVVLSIIAFVLAFIPCWTFLFIRYLFSPEGFWQNFALAALGVFLLGGIQILLLVVFLWFMVNMWFEP